MDIYGFSRLIHIAKGARARAARIAAGTTGATPGACARWGGRRALCRDRKDRELRFQPGGVAFRTLGLLLPVEQRFELMITFFADVFEDRHG